MSNTYHHYASRYESLSSRERGLLLLAVLGVMGFIFWWFYAESTLAELKREEVRSDSLQQEVNGLTQSVQQIEARLEQGVHKAKEERLAMLRGELERVKASLKQKAFELIEPEDMFALMGEMLFSESRLTLTSLKRKQVNPVFETEEQIEQSDIYRHVMQVGFSGSYSDILSYIQRMESLEWRLIWDQITLTTAEYPEIQVEIEISTLSDSQHWVGL